jgi:hypothetical protein
VPTDIQIYCACMERVRHHVGVADTVFAGTIDTGHRDLNTELIFLHFRKALELIAFSSLSANRERYSAVRARFATDWNARRILDSVEEVNPNFYPVPLTPSQDTAPGHRAFGRVADGFLTKDDFVTLYGRSSKLLHSRNPYAPGDPAVNMEHPIDEWSRRIKALLRLHFVELVDVHGLWVVALPNEGHAEVVTAMADGPFEVGPP